MTTSTVKMNDVSATKPWLASYPAGVPAEIGPLDYESLGDLFDTS